MTRFADLIRTLVAGDVNFIIVGGVAAAAHGSVRGTQDIDVVYERTGQNLERLVSALHGLDPYLRNAPPVGACCR